MGVWKFKDLNIIRMTEDQEDRFLESIESKFPDIHYRHNELPDLNYLSHDTSIIVREALLYALYKGVLEGIQQRKEKEPICFLETILWRAGWNPLPDETLEDMVYRNRGSRIGALETIARELGIDALFFRVPSYPPSPKKETT